MQITVSLSDQTLQLWQGAALIKCYQVSTALNGPGEQKDSGKTPRGKHIVRALIGAGAPLNTVFIGRRPTGEQYSPALAQQYPDRDWILTRIIWLSGCQHGYNRLGNVDTMQRYIYIHGTPDTEPMGIPLSHGCIRMRNDDVADLFDRISVGTPIVIEE